MAEGKKPEGKGPEIPDLDVGAPRPPRQPSRPTPEKKLSGAAWPSASGQHPRVSNAPVPDLAPSLPRVANIPERHASGAGWPAAPSAPPVRVSHAPGPLDDDVRPTAAVDFVTQPTQLPQTPPSSASGDDYFGTGNFDENHFGSEVDFLNIETSEPISQLRGFPSFPPLGDIATADAGAGFTRSDEPPTSIPRPKASPAARTAERRVWPTGTTPSSSSIQLDRAAVHLLADYGVAPAGSLLAPRYFLRVWRRRRRLQADVRALALRFGESELARDELLANLAEALRGMMPPDGAGSTLYGVVSEKDRRSREEQDALAGTNAEYGKRLRDLDDADAEVRRELSEARGRVVDRMGALGEAERNRDRADAKKKRHFIELTAIVERAAESGTAIPPDQAVTVSRLEAEIAAQKPELERLESVVASRQNEVATMRDAERRLQARAGEGTKKRRALDTDFQKQIGVQNQGAVVAARERTAALADVGRAILAARGRIVDVESDVLASVEKADLAVSDAATNIERHVRALDAHDRDAYRRGIVVLVVAIGAVAVLLLILTRR
jgi:uncharacterized coiled-coil protein SlyX